jgi:hypothetical protein
MRNPECNQLRILLCLLVIVLGLASVKPVANYQGYCTAGYDLRAWYYSGLEDTIAYLRTHPHRYADGGVAEYFVPKPEEVTGDNHEPRTTLGRILGNQNHLILSIVLTKVNDFNKGRTLFYVPNCIVCYVPDF